MILGVGLGVGLGWFGCSRGVPLKYWKCIVFIHDYYEFIDADKVGLGLVSGLVWLGLGVGLWDAVRIS